MLLSEFAKEVGLSPETVRFYVGKGLLKPRRGVLGGSNPYQVFSADDVTAVRMIQLQKSLGYTLSEISALNREYRQGAKSAARTGQVLRHQIDKLQSQRAALDAALTFLTEKLAWVEAGKPGDAPHFPC
ncbi:merR regulatory family protein [Delftia acidovorans]|jgi:MerR family copper efflux transcriptional regulator|uniref:MerR family transcriptional regulator n=1 Tax=Delftia TaxID=80865 RepID=UPI000504FCFD|nr:MULTISPECIES: MerR family transcriptional regulator [Delftia]ATH14569.1 MerR family transcriptional regulator [Delftia acidovorans]KFJ09357.1 merR regulatory family protein [Delftia acidovorans]MCA1071726.1 HTH-type transcriptional regulator CueR [Delftia acidovorans]MCB4787885.1 MerR family transcriptional regulator [Delftia sp. Lp-1]QQB51987.1 MerR family transcriptional regulator [Delftia acidovorans]